MVGLKVSSMTVSAKKRVRTPVFRSSSYMERIGPVVSGMRMSGCIGDEMSVAGLPAKSNAVLGAIVT